MIRSLLPNVLLVALALLGPTPSARARQATPAPDATVLRVVDQRLVDLPDASPISLSPDGRWLAVLQRGDEADAICAYDPVTLTEHRCTELGVSSVDWATARWSPDGTQLAFTEDWHWYFHESDLWVFDAEMGTATGLTDDGMRYNIGTFLMKGADEEHRAPIDLLPAWSPDGRELAFVRLQADADGTYVPSLYRIPAAGGMPLKVGDIDVRAISVVSVRWSPDGRSIFVSDWTAPGYPGRIRLVDAATGVPRAFAAPDPRLGPGSPILIEVTDSGDALLFFPEAMLNAGLDDRSAPIYAVVDLETGQGTPIAPVGDEPGSRFAVAATFSPGGDQLLVAYDRPEAPGALAIRDLAGSHEGAVAEFDFEFGGQFYGAGLTWAANGFVFGHGPGSTGMVLRLATG